MTHKTVPIEPTQAMLDAVFVNDLDWSDTFAPSENDRRLVYKAMLSAAPPSVAELVEALENVGEWINTLPAGTKAATTKGKMIDALLTRAKDVIK